MTNDQGHPDVKVNCAHLITFLSSQHLMNSIDSSPPKEAAPTHATTQTRSPHLTPTAASEQVSARPMYRLNMDQVYSWGLRGVAFLIVGIILFVAAIYYGLINP